ncbi:MAG: hypothetical protein IJG69_08480 [Spirochaetales bacterium]|nr:hypothetical protein [Spirochaetales bacterium]
MEDIIKWITANIGTVCTIICAFILLCSIIVKVTPTTKDEEFLGKLIKFLDHFSIAKTANDKKYIEDAKKNLEG